MQDKRSSAPDPAPGFPVRVGVVDMGSNAIRFVIADFIAPSTWTALVSERLPVRLADHVFETGLLSDDAIEAAVAVMERFRDVTRRARGRIITAPSRPAPSGKARTGGLWSGKSAAERDCDWR